MQSPPESEGCYHGSSGYGFCCYRIYHRRQCKRPQKPILRSLPESGVSGASPDELSSISAGTTKRGALFGDTENGFILAGMSLTHLTKIQSAKEIVEELVSETERRLAAAPGLI